MLTKLYKHYQIPYVVSVQEANMQVGRQWKGAVIVTKDGDYLVAYGNTKTFIIDVWGNEAFQIINMEEPLTDAMKKYLLSMPSTVSME
jgi:hypothetical protein